MQPETRTLEDAHAGLNSINCSHSDTVAARDERTNG
jgi:hypothetical protein